MRRNRVSLGNSSVKTGRVSRFGAEIDSEGAQDTIEWEISLYVGRTAGPVPLICPITSDQSFDLSPRAKCCLDKKEMAGNMGWTAAITAGRRDFYCDNCGPAPPSFVQPGLLTPGLYYWWINGYSGRQV